MIFTFDLDETLLCNNQGLLSLNAVERTPSNYDPYQGAFSGCHTLQKEKTKKIMQDILKNGDEIAFITAGSIKKSEIKQFFQIEYSIDLGNDFQHYYNTRDKTSALIEIAGENCYTNIVLIDNYSPHIESADTAGFKTIYADNNKNDLTNGTHYIQQLEEIIAERTIKPYYKQAEENLAAAIRKRELEHKIAFLTIIEKIKELDLLTSRKLSLTCCYTLGELCKIISEREPYDFKAITPEGDMLIKILNDYKNYHFKRKISPHDKPVHMGDIRRYALSQVKDENKQTFSAQNSEKEKAEAFLKVKETLKTLDIEESKKSAIDKAQTLPNLCAAVLEKVKDLKSTAPEINQLVELLNHHSHYLLRIEITKINAAVCEEDLWKHAKYEEESSSQYFLISSQDDKNIKNQSQEKSDSKEPSSLMFQHHSVSSGAGVSNSPAHTPNNQ
ncbi:hypothetical protein Psal071_00198 [Piscirickettsia salmonis]|uniref:Uncharacterized protein n=2 Tax=Piscirickettsia salmonis TaxID=1238 RepID=A0A9Q6LHT4_PISSA|nr:tetratricopeptide repeat family protein [Piscirickettsia salmonis]ERL62062.1 hypothetical protein K661_01586 [Piscirickettsia salmonis LF-89 = ATCC VR-1361]QGN76034.1 hypothetical protein Psal001_00202 [Piscirickettsia salmonis]QGN79597.1 hypothetical protein Psal002_00200 [Piscirickettsia salmonis]QGN83186.1 hypothetical protein Psal003_00199 [Piscirickettsia salmonis]